MSATIVVFYVAWMLVAVSRQLNDALYDYSRVAIDASLMLPRALNKEMAETIKRAESNSNPRNGQDAISQSEKNG